ncbi:hypothetical protein LTR85_002937 [Meristemomyces frigidus]|nr:hypothetical protein LTR85_002937 [Meristemomyces frigidus]
MSGTQSDPLFRYLAMCNKDIFQYECDHIGGSGRVSHHRGCNPGWRKYKCRKEIEKQEKRPGRREGLCPGCQNPGSNLPVSAPTLETSEQCGSHGDPQSSTAAATDGIASGSSAQIMITEPSTGQVAVVPTQASADTSSDPVSDGDWEQLGEGAGGEDMELVEEEDGPKLKRTKDKNCGNDKKGVFQRLRGR